VTDFFAHPSAIIEPGARLGADTKVWHFCHVSAGVEIGRGCSLGQNVYVAPGVKIGDGVRIQNNVSIYTGVVLEDYVFCGPSMVFTNVKRPRAAFPLESSVPYATTRIRYGATIGANATVICGVTVGQWAFVAAGAVVSRDVADYAESTGVPARQTGWVCQCGERLRFESSAAVCGGCQRPYALDGEGRPEPSPR